ncbi:MAG: tetratricopeptide repeat protein [Bryobacteraceae bacterium]
MRTLKLVSENGNPARYDAQVLLAAIYRRERKPAEAISLLTGLIARFPRNYLFRLEAVQMHSDAGDKEQALGALSHIEMLKRAGSPGFAELPIEKIFCYRGNLLFWYNDFDGAVEQLRQASQRPAGLDPHTAVMTWLRLGQTHDMRGKRKEALDSYRRAIAVAPLSDAAKESKSYLSSPYKRA